MKKFSEALMHGIFLLAATTSIIAVLLICYFIFTNGLPALFEIGFREFLLGTSWKPNNIPPSFGILSMIVGSGIISLIATMIGVPIGILTAIFMSFFCPKVIYRYLKSGIDLLAGIPSIVYGFFGLIVIVPFVADTFGGNGISILSAGIVLGLMILPTIISVSEASLKAVNKHYYENSLALGATKEQSVFFVCVPAAKSGILSAIILGIGRAIGETMAVIMVAGNQARLPKTILKGIRTLTSNIVLEMGYATDLHSDALIATAVVLFVFILIINLSFSYMKRKI